MVQKTFTMSNTQEPTFILTNGTVTITDCVNVSTNMFKVQIDPSIVDAIKKSREYVDKLVDDGKIVYGLTTGFGRLNDKFISKEDTAKLQENLIRSHAIGFGKPSPKHIVRCMLFIRLVCFCRANSGVSLELCNKLVEVLNKNYVPMVPKSGSIGASGDLCPLAHATLGLMGEGTAFDSDSNTYIDSALVMKKLNIEPITLKSCEGLSMNNGTQFITSNALFAFHNAQQVYKAANMTAAMTIEALHATHKAFDPLIHQAKPHKGQIYVAEKINSYILENGEPSEIGRVHATKTVQNSYDIRCIPQVHGPVHDSLAFIENIITTEINSSNDNPLVFPDEDKTLSGGNFHGMYIGMVSDQITYAMTLLCNISERRLDHLLNPDLNKCLPAFLVENPGLNSGFMITEYTSAALVGHNRQLCSPSSIHSISTCNGFESVVSMGATAAKNSCIAVENTYGVIALELFAACQALDFTKETTTSQLQKIHHHIRHHGVPHIDTDTYMKPYFDIITDMLKNDAFGLN